MSQHRQHPKHHPQRLNLNNPEDNDEVRLEASTYQERRALLRSQRKNTQPQSPPQRNRPNVLGTSPVSPIQSHHQITRSSRALPKFEPQNVNQQSIPTRQPIQTPTSPVSSFQSQFISQDHNPHLQASKSRFLELDVFSSPDFDADRIFDLLSREAFKTIESNVSGVEPTLNIEKQPAPTSDYHMYAKDMDAWDISNSSSLDLGDFTPKKFLKIFKAQASHLLELSKQSSNSIASLAPRVQVSSDRFHSQISFFSSEFSSLLSKFSDLNDEISLISHTTVPIGKKLAKLHNERENAQKSLLYLKLFKSLQNHVEITPNELKVPQLQSLIEDTDHHNDTVELFQVFSQSLQYVDTLPRINRLRAIISHYFELLERDIVNRMVEAMQVDDNITMKHNAKLLHKLNGGTSAIRTYLGHFSQFFNISNFEDVLALSKNYFSALRKHYSNFVLQPNHVFPDWYNPLEYLIYFSSKNLSIEDFSLVDKMISYSPSQSIEQLTHRFFSKPLAPSGSNSQKNNDAQFDSKGKRLKKHKKSNSSDVDGNSKYARRRSRPRRKRKLISEIDPNKPTELVLTPSFDSMQHRKKTSPRNRSSSQASELSDDNDTDTTSEDEEEEEEKTPIDDFLILGTTPEEEFHAALSFSKSTSKSKLGKNHPDNNDPNETTPTTIQPPIPPIPPETASMLDKICSFYGLPPQYYNVKAANLHCQAADSRVFVLVVVPTMTYFFRDTISVLEKETNRISVVFPNSEFVLSRFVRNIFEVRILGFVQEMIKFSTSLAPFYGNLVVLRTKCLAYRLTQLFYNHSAPWKLLTSKKVPFSIIKEIFSNLGSHLEDETQFLYYLFGNSLKPFHHALATHAKEKKGFSFNKFYKSSSNSEYPGTTSLGQGMFPSGSGSLLPNRNSSEIAENTSGMLFGKYSGRGSIDLNTLGDNDFVLPSAFGEIPTIAATMPSLQLANQMIKADLESVQRCALLSDKISLPSHIQKIVTLLLSFLQNYLSQSLQLAIEKISSHKDPSHMPPTRFFELVFVLNTIISHLKQHVTNNVLTRYNALFFSDINSKSIIRMTLDNNVSLLEEMVLQGLNLLLNSFSAHVKHLITKYQKKTDFFNPKDLEPEQPRVPKSTFNKDQPQTPKRPTSSSSSASSSPKQPVTPKSKAPPSSTGGKWSLFLSKSKLMLGSKTKQKTLSSKKSELPPRTPKKGGRNLPSTSVKTRAKPQMDSGNSNIHQKQRPRTTKHRKPPVLPDIISDRPTDACAKVLGALTTHVMAVRRTLPSSIQQDYLEQIGLRLYDSLIRHIKNFTISSTGGLQLTRDLSAYSRAVSDFGPVVAKRFHLLQKLPKLYHVRPETLPLLFTESELSSVDQNDLITFAKLRADWKTNKIGKLLKTE